MAAPVLLNSAWARGVLVVVALLLTGFTRMHVSALPATSQVPADQTTADQVSSGAPPAAAPARAEKNFADYELSVSLDPSARTLHGTANLELTNISKSPLSELYFHLYFNAFSHKNTQFLRSGKARSGRPLGAPGSVEVHSLTSPSFGETNLWDHADPHSPGDPDDKTDIRVPLPVAIAPGATARFRLTFTSIIPELVERSGVARDFFLLGQWFPKLAKLEPDGSFRHFAYHSAGEFYSNFANYVVRLDVPDDYILGSTGTLRQLTDSTQGRAVYLAEARNVVDFAWTAWPKFVKTDVVLSGVHVHVLGPSGTDALRSATIHTLSHGLSYLQKRLGDYPYADLTVVLPPPFASPAEGMEYPQFITTRSSVALPLLGVRMVELITIHEFIHQWFQSVIASDEMTAPFLDESITSFLEWIYLDQQLVPPGLTVWPALQLSRAALGRFFFFSQPGYDKNPTTIASAVEQFKTFGELAQVIYGRGPLALWTLGHSAGDPNLDRVLSNYAAQFRFQHPTIADFLGVVEQQLGTDARRQAHLMLYENASLDLSLGEVKSARTPTGYHSTIEVKHKGALTLNYPLRLSLADGSSLVQNGISDQPTKLYHAHHRSPLVRVELDPDHHILLDSNLLDNRKSFTQSKLSEPGPAEGVPAQPKALSRDQTRARTSSLVFSLVSWLLHWGAA